jgi:hypothetical protein
MCCHILNIRIIPRYGWCFSSLTVSDFTQTALQARLPFSTRSTHLSREGRECKTYHSLFSFSGPYMVNELRRLALAANALVSKGEPPCRAERNWIFFVSMGNSLSGTSFIHHLWPHWLGLAWAQSVKSWLGRTSTDMYVVYLTCFGNVNTCFPCQ